MRTESFAESVGLSRGPPQIVTTYTNEPVVSAERESLLELKRQVGLAERTGEAPEAEIVRAAAAWLHRLRVELEECKLPWLTPNVSVAAGEIALEWWVGRRKGTVLFGPVQPVWLKVWGADPIEEMQDGTLEPGAGAELVRWLLGH